MSVRLKKRSATFGVRVRNTKLTAGIPIEAAPLPKTVIIPLQLNSTAVKPLVKRGDKVLTGQKIADSDEFDAVPVHATVSGDVANITTAVNPATGQPMQVVVINSDGADKKAEFKPVQNLEGLSSDDILKRIREAGIVSVGNGSLPAHVSLSMKYKKIDAVILNGCECEPYMTAEHRMMLEYGEKILSGLNVMKKVLSPSSVLIAVCDDKEDAMKNLETLIVQKNYDFKIVPVVTKYPVGDEKALIKAVTGKEVPVGGLAADIGVAVFDVSTAKAIHEAVYEGKPVIEGVVTVTGAVNNPKNLLVRFGTPIKDLLEYAGGVKGDADQIIVGGPMTGIAQSDPGFPITKDNDCIVAKKVQLVTNTNCISCGQCIEVCPLGLMPTLFPKYAKKGRYGDCEAYYVGNCDECGVCAYVCPANIPIVQYIRIAKKEIQRRAAKT